MAHDKQEQVTSRTGFKGTTSTYQYDHRRRLTKSIDPVDDVTVTYASDGLLDSVTDGLGHVTAYDYDGAFRLTVITDAVSKVVKYFYDSYGRMTKVGAGSTGTFDPTQYFFSASTGLMTKVRYTSGANTYDAKYYYDGLARGASACAASAGDEDYGLDRCHERVALRVRRWRASDQHHGLR